MKHDREAEELAQSLFFIIGTGRSGTTLLQAMLSSHSQLLVPPETRFFALFDPAKHFTDPLFDELVEKYLRSCTQHWWWLDLGLDSDAFRGEVHKGMRSSREIFLWMLQQLPTGSGKSKVGEKTPGHWMFADRLLAWFPQAKFIHICRDPRDVVVSLRNQCWWIPKSVMSSAMYCRMALEELKLLAQKLGPQRFFVLRYETLVGQPESELRRLCRFLGEDYEPGMLRFHERQERGFLEVEEDWKGLTLKPLTKARVGIYREQLQPREIRTVEHILGPLMAEYAYELDTEVEYDPGWLEADLAEKKNWELRRSVEGSGPYVDEQLVLGKRAAMRSKRRVLHRRAGT